MCVHAPSRSIGLFIGLAFLSRRALLTATVLNAVAWIGNFAYLAVADVQFKVVAMGYALIFVWGAYALLRIALDIRAAERNSDTSDLQVAPL